MMVEIQLSYLYFKIVEFLLGVLSNIFHIEREIMFSETWKDTVNILSGEY